MVLLFALAACEDKAERGPETFAGPFVQGQSAPGWRGGPQPVEVPEGLERVRLTKEPLSFFSRDNRNRKPGRKLRLLRLGGSAPQICGELSWEGEEAEGTRSLSPGGGQVDDGCLAKGSWKPGRYRAELGARSIEFAVYRRIFFSPGSCDSASFWIGRPGEDPNRGEGNFFSLVNGTRQAAPVDAGTVVALLQPPEKPPVTVLARVESDGWSDVSVRADCKSLELIAPLDP